MTTTSSGEPAQSTADREIVISQVIDAPREVVFEAFGETTTEPETAQEGTVR